MFLPDEKRGAPDPRQIALRRAFVTAILLAVFAVLAGRLVWIQGPTSPRWKTLARKYHQGRRSVAGRRGMVLDRRGRKLAVSMPTESVFVNPRLVQDKPRAARRLAGILGLDEAFVLRRLSRKGYFAWIKRRITAEEAEAVHALKLRGLGFRTEPLRVYPYGTLAAHVLGAVGIDNAGLAGLEQKYDRLLAGRPGSEIVLRDGLGRDLAVRGRVDDPAVHGRTLVLTLDAVVQKIAEEELARAVEKWGAKGGAVVVLEAGTSQVLAMASHPTFDPNRFGQAEDNARLNRAIGMIYEPGSTFKPFTAAVALDTNRVRPETRFFCGNGAERFGRRVLHDSHPMGWLSLRDVIVKSSNIGIARVAELLGRYALHHAALRFGFGSRTGVDLPGEEAGILRPPEQWTAYSMTSIPMGQEISVTPLAMAAGYNVFAAGGLWLRPHLALAEASHDGRRILRTFAAPVGRPAILRRTANLLRCDLLAAVVQRGTGRRVKSCPFSVAGKTGTAQIARVDGRGYEPDAYIGSFVGIAPVARPRAVCIVMIERPKKAHYGGTVAAPAVAAILERALTYLGVPCPKGEVAQRRGGRT